MTLTKLRAPRRWRVTILGCVGVLMLAACSSQSAAGGSDNPSATGTSAHVVQEAQKRIDALYAGATFGEPRTDGPAAFRGARVAMVNDGTQAPTGSLVAENAKQIAKIMGWNLSVYDGAFSPSKYQDGIRQAIAEKADVIWLYAIDCPVVRTALEEAKAAGIPVIAQEAADCSDVDSSAPSLFTHNLQFAEGSFLDWGRALGAAQADWLIAQTNGSARVIEVSVPDLVVTQAVHDGFVARMRECTTCKIVQTVENSASALGPELQAKIEQAILRNPSANGLAVSYDDLMTSGGAAAVMASGRSAALNVVSGTGFPANIELVRKDQGQDAGYGLDYSYETWATADLLNRFLSDAPVKPSGVSLGFFDHAHGLPKSGAYVSPIDYRSVYTKVWQG